MNQIIDTEMVTFNIPKHYLSKLITIMQSGALDLKNDKAILHFDNDGMLRIVEYAKKYTAQNLTE